MARVSTIWDSSSADLAKIQGVSTDNVAKVYSTDYTNTVVIPEGLILPLRGAGAVPTDWTIFSSADGKYIPGAGTTYSPGDNGAGTGNINLSHLGGGSHTGNLPRYGSSAGQAGTSSQANHTHTTMTFTQPLPYYTENRLIKADSDLVVLPQDVCVMKHSAGGWSGLTRLVPDSGNRYFRANSADGFGHNVSSAVTSSTNGAHNHGTIAGTLPAGDDNNSNEALVTYGGHFHSFTASLTITLKYLALSMWYSASGTHVLDGTNYIGMYESVTPPTGWSLCNGSNGTPDMRDCFILHIFADTPGGSAGSNNITCTSVTDSTGGHIHYSRQCNSCPNTFDRHSDTQGAHTHTCNHNAAWTPPYYSLAFIMYTG